MILQRHMVWTLGITYHSIPIHGPVVGDIAPREGISKAEKSQRESVRQIMDFRAALNWPDPAGSDAQFRPWHVTWYSSCASSRGALEGMPSLFCSWITLQPSYPLQEYEEGQTAEAKFVKGARPVVHFATSYIQLNFLKILTGLRWLHKVGTCVILWVSDSSVFFFGNRSFRIWEESWRSELTAILR